MELTTRDEELLTELIDGNTIKHLTGFTGVLLSTIFCHLDTPEDCLEVLTHINTKSIEEILELFSAPQELH